MASKPRNPRPAATLRPGTPGAGLDAIARDAAAAIALVTGDTAEAAVLRAWRAQDAHRPALDLYERLRHAEHAVARCYPELARELRGYGEQVEELA